jgi:O-antigen ligase
VLVGALAEGQLLFNRKLPITWRLFLAASLLAVVIYAFVQQRDAVSNWIGVAVVAAPLLWLRYRRLRVPLIVLVVALAALGLLIPTLYNFAGGDAEWQLSGNSRLVLSRRVIEVTMRNPITGLGPAAYRPYTRMQPLVYGYANYLQPNVNAHNNYVDLFSHTGLLGLGLFLWFMGEVAWLGWRLRKRFVTGFAAGYVNGMLAAWASIMVIMMLLDWFLPFVYNVGFGGFQASVLVWMFLGGLVALENMPGQGDSTNAA